MVCSRGPDQSFTAWVTAPATAASGSTYTVRIDSVPSGRIGHAGLNYIYGMTTDYVLPTGASYVAGSARLVAATGSENVRRGARAWQEQGIIHVLLPQHVSDQYTPPSVEFQLLVSAPAGTSLDVKFSQHHLLANVFLLGNLTVTCAPYPKPFTIGKTLVTAPVL